ncbi:hypothetical protein GGR54DRAFT_637693 [Hypoxylon sp. NC1633]|nr:hypothetical protein GGR54DRAFT_637693 [Hypoxylon sp. NC1633]
MANLPSQHPHLSLHLTDRALTPLITSSRSRPQLEALTSLTHAALSAHESALRLGLGSPQRIMVEHADAGPVLLHSFLRAEPASSTSRPSSAPTTATTPTPTAATNGRPAADDGTEGDDDATTLVEADADLAVSPHTTMERRLQQLQLHSGAADSNPGASTSTLETEDANAAPMLVGVVASPGPDDARDARRAAARLERVGREVQARWAEVQQAPDARGRGGDAGD